MHSWQNRILFKNLNSLSKIKITMNVIKKNSLKEIRKSSLLKKLQSAHNKGDVKDYPLCSDCYVSDRRVDMIFDNLVKYIIFKNPNQTASFYQNKINDIVDILKLKNNYYDNLTKLELIN